MKKLFTSILALTLIVGCSKVYIEDADQNQDAFFYVDFEGAQMPVLVEGNVSSGKFIVVVHGGPGGAGMSYIGTPSIEKLEEDFAVVYYNQRLSDGATALSDDEISEPTRAQYAEDLNAILNTLKHKYGESSQFYLMGHSWGGELVTEFMSTPDYQDQVNGMINVSGLLKLSDTWKERISYIHELLIEISQIEISEGENLERWNEILDYCNSIDTASIEEYGTQLWDYGWSVSWNYLMEEGKTNHQVITGFDTYDLAPNIANGHGTAPGQSIPNGFLISNNPSDFFEDVTDRNNQTNDLINITKPSLIISGKYDCVVPPKLSEALYNGISSSNKTYVEMDSIGHDPYNRGEDFYNLVYSFVDQY